MKKKDFSLIYLHLLGLNKNLGRTELINLIENMIYYMEYWANSPDPEKSKSTIINKLFGSNYEMMDNYIKMSWKLMEKEISKMNEKINKKKFMEDLLAVYLDFNESQSFSNLLDIHQDVYLLSRLFIKFEKSKMQRGPIGCRTNKWQEMKNIIVYAGNSHIEMYVSFFKKYFETSPHPDFNITTKSEDGYQQCIKLPYPFDFFKQN
jgi:hypothetical protein